MLSIYHMPLFTTHFEQISMKKTRDVILAFLKIGY